MGKCTGSVLCRALLGSGSQSNFITEEIVQALKLKKIKTSHEINGIGAVSQHVYSFVHASFESRFNNYEFSLKMLVVPKITGDLPAKNVTNIRGIPANINLADPLYCVPQKVDILIGATHFYDLLCDQKIKLNLAGPVLQKTKLGWIVSGPVSSSGIKTEITNTVVHHAISTHTNAMLDNLLPLFWRTEEVENDAPFTAEEKM